LGVDGKTVGVEKDDGLEIYPLGVLDIDFGKEFQFFPDEFNPLSVATVD
jgi:hypothetical protein